MEKSELLGNRQILKRVVENHGPLTFTNIKGETRTISADKLDGWQFAQNAVTFRLEGGTYNRADFLEFLYCEELHSNPQQIELPPV